MKSSKHFSGNTYSILNRVLILFFISALFFSKNSHALHDDFENHNYARPTFASIGLITGVYVLSEIDGGPIIFGTVYSLSALYLLNERYTIDSDLTQLMIPLGLFTLSLVNFALLNEEDDFSKNDVFIYNTVGLSLLAAYAIWEHSNPHARIVDGQTTQQSKIHIAVHPYTKANEFGAILNINY